MLSLASPAPPAPNAQHCIEHRNKGCRAEVNDFPADELAPSAPNPLGAGGVQSFPDDGAEALMVGWRGRGGSPGGWASSATCLNLILPALTSSQLWRAWISPAPCLCAHPRGRARLEDQRGQGAHPGPHRGEGLTPKGLSSLRGWHFLWGPWGSPRSNRPKVQGEGTAVSSLGPFWGGGGT